MNRWKPAISGLSISITALILAAPDAERPAASESSYNVVNFGAKGDGKTKDTRALQESIDACRRNGGGTVYFPPGTYLSGSLHLKSGVALYLDHGAVLKASKEEEDFDWKLEERHPERHRRDGRPENLPHFRHTGSSH